jgi:hypothetical protein
MLYDEFDNSDVTLAVDDRQDMIVSLHIQTLDRTVQLAVCDTSAYNSTTGGVCTALVDPDLFQTAQTLQVASLLRVSLASGTIVADTSASVVLVGAPEHANVGARTAFIYGPNRFIYPGEVVTFPVFANTNGEAAKAFSVSVQFDNTLFEIVNEVEAGPGWQVRLSATARVLRCSAETSS